MTCKRVGVLVTAAVAAVGLGGGLILAGCGSPATVAARSRTQVNPGYSWYRTMMGRTYGATMMGGTSYPRMMGGAGYRWMTGGARAPGWMQGGSLPGFMTGMMGTGADPGRIMGRLWASAPGPRITPADAGKLGTQVPAGGRVNRAAGTITFMTPEVRFTVLASPAGGPDETFRIAGMVNPTVIVPAGSRVTIQVINADMDTAHGLVVAAGRARSSWMPMMADSPAFSGSAMWFLGNPTAAGMHAGVLRFNVSRAGTYHYLCPVPGHARKGMIGTFVVRAAK